MPCNGFGDCIGNTRCNRINSDFECLNVITRLKQIKEPGEKSTYCFNPEGNEVLLYKVDEHVIMQKIDGDIEKCDYLFVLRNTEKKDALIFLELKGQDINKALTQLESSINVLKPFFRNNQYKYNCRIVCSKVPNIRNNNKLESFKKKLALLNGEKYSEIYFKTKSLKLEESYSKFFV